VFSDSAGTKVEVITVLHGTCTDEAEDAEGKRIKKCWATNNEPKTLTHGGKVGSNIDRVGNEQQTYQ
jgi:hypothetical protein